jgi:hypothetical protein
MLLAAAAVCGGGPAVRAAEYKPDFPAVAKEVMKMQKHGDSMVIVLWLPPEYFASALDGNPRLTAAQKDETAKMLSPYSIIAVVDSTVGAFGSMTYKSEADLRKETCLIDDKGNKKEPLDENDISDDAKVFLGAFTPAVANVIGPMGKNMHVYLFPAKDDEGKSLYEAKGKGQFRVNVGKNEFRWRLPLGSLLAPKKCVKCKEECSGAYDFCPWCGERLKAKSE